MATDRKCGWCEERGHQKRNCEVYHKLRLDIWQNTIKGRQEILDLMAQKGLGNGAIIEYADFSANKIFMTLQQGTNIRSWRFYSYRNIKYSKRVTATLHTGTNAMFDTYAIEALHIANGTSDTVGISRYGMTHGGSGGDNLSWGRFHILSPSHTPYDVEPSMLKENIIIPLRLATKVEAEKVSWGECIIDESELRM